MRLVKYLKYTEIVSQYVILSTLQGVPRDREEGLQGSLSF